MDTWHRLVCGAKFAAATPPLLAASSRRRFHFYENSEVIEAVEWQAMRLTEAKPPA
jgi:hypothetical protein